MRHVGKSSAAPPIVVRYSARDEELQKTGIIIMDAEGSACRNRYCDSAFEQRVGKYVRYIKRLTLRLTRDPDESDDLTQNVLLKIFRNREHFMAVTDQKSWIASVTRHQFIDRYRQIMRERALFPHPFVEDEVEDILFEMRDHADSEGFREIDNIETKGILDAALEHLTEQQRTIVVLHEVEGLSVEAVAVHFSMPINTVKSTLSRSRLRLRRILAARTAGHVSDKLRSGWKDVSELCTLD